MTTITLPRTVVQQALDALLAAMSDDQLYLNRCADSIAVLRAALEQPQDLPVVWTGADGARHEITTDYAARIAKFMFDRYGDVPGVDAALAAPPQQADTAPVPQPGMWRKKPVVVAAFPWFKNGDHPEDYAKDTEGFENGELRVFTGAERKAKGWEGGVVRYYRHPDVPGDSLCEQCGKPHHVHGWIDTLEQGHRVCPGDWIITGVKGERYPCKPDIFALTYEPAAPAPSESAQPDALALLREALKKIAAIENKMYGPDWEEIDEAREIAVKALAKIDALLPRKDAL